MRLKLGSISGNLVRIILALGLVCLAFWWPTFYIRYLIPPCDDDRSGVVIIGGLPYVFAGLVYGLFGFIGLLRATRQSPAQKKTKQVFAAFALFVPTASAALHLLITIGPLGV